MNIHGKAPGKVYELLKEEYAGCRQRYEDIYKAIWLQFNYFFVGVGALLAFGKESFGLELLAIFASVPIIFWYWATYEPLNRYADQTAKRAAEIEETLRNEHNATIKHYTDFQERRSKASLGSADKRPEPWKSQLRTNFDNCSCKVWWDKIWVNVDACFWTGLGAFLSGVAMLTLFRISNPGLELDVKHLEPFRPGFLLAGIVSFVVAARILPSGLTNEKCRNGVRSAVRAGSVVVHMVFVSSLLVSCFTVAKGKSLGPEKRRPGSAAPSANAEVKLAYMKLARFREINEGCTSDNE